MKSDAALALLEEGTTVRSALARDDYDARRWTDEAADSREQIAVSRSVITNAVDGTTTPLAPTAQNSAPTTNSSSVPPAGAESPNPILAEPVRTDPKPPAETKGTTSKLPSQSTAAVDQLERRPEPNKPIIVPSAPREDNAAAKQPQATEPAPKKEAGPMQVGSLVSFATKQSTPVYPAVARSMRTTGIVRVDVMVNELGEVTEVQRTSGPTLLQDAAKDAVMKWRFKPFVRDGQPVRATGFVSFNFSL
ncbi:MAG: TonB family protein [Chloracidobacterium sp.]|nr:TonB family protein [Chloracidobacterium sp.]